MLPTIKPEDPNLFWKESLMRNIFTSFFLGFALLLVVHLAGVARIPLMQGVVDDIVLPLRKFGQDSWRLFNRCSKPSRKEFSKVAFATAIGFCLMGFLGFFVKLVHIPINNIIVS